MGIVKMVTPTAPNPPLRIRIAAGPFLSTHQTLYASSGA